MTESQSSAARPPAVMVTGGAGFIGCALASDLLRRGLPVVAVDSMLEQVHPGRARPEALPSDVELVVADVSQADVWDELLSRYRPELVVHLAAETGTGQSLTQSTRHAESNVVGTTAMVDAFVRHESLPTHLVLTSSRAVYGEGAWRGRDGVFYPPPRSHAQLAHAEWDHLDPDGHPSEPLPLAAATTHPNPSSIYGATKLAQELIVRNWGASFSVPVSVFRLQNVYGPGQSPYNPYTGIITLFHRLASAGRSLDIYEDGRIGRDFVYIDDVVAALLAGIDQPPAPDRPRILDVGTGTPTLIADAAAMIAEYHSAPTPHVSGSFRDGDVRYAVADTSDLLAALPWQPTVDFRTGSAAVAEWLRAGGHLG